MPAAGATALHSFLCFSHQKPSSLPPNCDQLSTTLTAKPKSPLQKHPLYTPTHANLSLQIKEKILCLEIMGVDAGKALSQNPSLHGATLESIHSIISFLQSKGIRQSDLPRIFGMCPKVLTSSIKTDLYPVFSFLSQELKVPDHSFRRVINRCPRLLASSVRDQLKPALVYLRRLGFKNMEALAYHDSVLLVSSVENTLIPKLKYLESLGLSRDDAVGMVLRCPSLLTFSIENNFKPKYEYLAEVMEKTMEELKEFPQYFAFSLEKRIKPRHVKVLQSGMEIPLPLMLKSTDEEFEELMREGGG
ncbi:mTERF domain-containing protein 1, mitochondrial [Morella rubra]|uniref:mTERF domain-containing protein 1, mitochondrial n=1 Tax=Morella rubra TaxID=262757 RepID=A0A6A1WBY7_9ROSI|nr:mTERF domain-containing protein 1, mitochondrial [Morella rubra]